MGAVLPTLSGDLDRLEARISEPKKRCQYKIRHLQTSIDVKEKAVRQPMTFDERKDRTRELMKLRVRKKRLEQQLDKYDDVIGQIETLRSAVDENDIAQGLLQVTKQVNKIPTLDLAMELDRETIAFDSTERPVPDGMIPVDEDELDDMTRQFESMQVFPSVPIHVVSDAITQPVLYNSM